MDAAEILKKLGIPLKNQVKTTGTAGNPKTSLKWILIGVGIGLVVGGIIVYNWSAKQYEAKLDKDLDRLAEKQISAMTAENERFLKKLEKIFASNQA